MDWRVRIAWWAVVVACASLHAEAGRGFGGWSGGRAGGAVSRGGSWAGGRLYRTPRPVTRSPITPECFDRSYGSAHQKAGIPTKWYHASENSEQMSRISGHMPKETSLKAIMETSIVRDKQAEIIRNDGMEKFDHLKQTEASPKTVMKNYDQHMPTETSLKVITETSIVKDKPAETAWNAEIEKLEQLNKLTETSEMRIGDTLPDIPENIYKDTFSQSYDPAEAPWNIDFKKYDLLYKQVEDSLKAITETYPRSFMLTEAPQRKIFEMESVGYRPARFRWMSIPKNYDRLTETSQKVDTAKYDRHFQLAAGSQKAITVKYDRHKPTAVPPTSSIHRHRHGHTYRTEPSAARHNTTISHNISRHGGNRNPFQVKQQPIFLSKPPVTSSYNGSLDAFQTGVVAGYLQLSQKPSRQRRRSLPRHRATSWNDTARDVSQAGGGAGRVQPLPASTSSYHYPSSIPSWNTWGWICDCYVKDKTAVCLYNLTDDQIPPCVSSTITAVFIHSKEVNQLSVNAFRHVPHLEYLNITDTKLQSLPRDLFRDIRDLKHLLVQNNPELSFLDSDLFRDATKLEDVILDRNEISSLDRDVFTHLTNVKRMNLAYNKIRSLPEGIFKDNRELQELDLSGNPLHIRSDMARDLLRNNAKLWMLLMRDCKLEDLPSGLLRNATNLEWLDLSGNEISEFPSEFIQDCTKLAYLGLAYNKLKALGSDVLHQHGGSLTTLQLEGNPWLCDCDLLPLAGWAALWKDAVPGRPTCSSPHGAKNEPLDHWFHSKDALKCSGTTSSLRMNLNRVISVARSFMKHKLTSSTNLLPVSEEEVSFAATNYFLHAMAARTDEDIDSVVGHWAWFLEKFLGRLHFRYTGQLARNSTNQIGMDRTPLIPRKIEKDPADVNIDYKDTEWPSRLKGFEPLVNFTYIIKGFPENLTLLIDSGMEEELKILFGVTNGTNASSPNTTAGNATTPNSTGLNVPADGMEVPPNKLNAMKRLVAGLRSELREVLSTLLLSIDRAKWDAAYQKSVKEEDEKAKKATQL